MLPKAYRLRNTRDFNRVYKRGRSYVHPLLVLYVLPTAQPGCRIGFSISKKLGGAVDRNRIKRHLREICRARIPELRSGVDAVFVARTRLKEARLETVSSVVGELFRRAKITGESSAGDAACGNSVSH